MIVKVRYVGKSFGVDGLTNGSVYSVLDVGIDEIRIIDDSGDDYLYSLNRPAPIDGSSSGGKWEVVEDDAEGTLQKRLKQLNQK